MFGPASLRAKREHLQSYENQAIPLVSHRIPPTRYNTLSWKLLLNGGCMKGGDKSSRPCDARSLSEIVPCSGGFA